jgi:membrane protein YqaA with SNARE-associated domain
MLYQIFTVGLLATFEIYVAIATGLAFNLSSNMLFIATLIGGIVGALASVFLGDQIKQLILKLKKPKPVSPDKPVSAKTKMLKALWDKYGVIGVGFIGTFLVGAPISIGIGIGFGVPAKRLMYWCLAAVVIRSFVFSYFFNYVKLLISHG